MLDTETCAAILRGSDAAVMERLSRVAVGEVSISAVTLSELTYGVEVSRRTAQDRTALEVFLRHVRVLEYPSAAAEHYGMVRMVLELCAVPGDDAGICEGAGVQTGAGDGSRELGGELMDYSTRLSQVREERVPTSMMNNRTQVDHLGAATNFERGMVRLISLVSPVAGRTSKSAVTDSPFQFRDRMLPKSQPPSFKQTFSGPTSECTRVLVSPLPPIGG